MVHVFMYGMQALSFLEGLMSCTCYVHLKNLTLWTCWLQHTVKIVSEYDQEIPQLQTADKPMAPRGRATQQSQNLCKKATQI